jgi:ATP-dependent DNA helicase PIF1
VVSGGVGRWGVQKQFPTLMACIPILPNYSREYSKSKKKKKREKEKVVDSSQSEEIGSSRVLTLVDIASKKLKEIEIARTEAPPNESMKESSPPLSAEQEALLSLAVEGLNIFYTGSAGCGKSVVLKAIRNRLRKMGKIVRVLAPTGMVALANGGETIWSFAGWTPNTHKLSLPELIKKLSEDSQLKEQLTSADTIIFDEISMVGAPNFERLNQLMKAARSPFDDRSTRPFGGTQIIITGDFCQLPPVKPFSHCYKCGSDLTPNKGKGIHICPNTKCGTSYRDGDKWTFRSKAWDECNFRYVYLKEIYRQKDPTFKKLLQKIRLGRPLRDSDLQLLANCDAKMDTHEVKLYPTREEVRKVNDEEFRKLKAPSQTYNCVDVFLWNEEKHPHLRHKGIRETDGSLKDLKQHNLDNELQLKKGMQVMLLHNIDIRSGLYNGAQGIIVGFEPFGYSVPHFMIHRESLPVYWPNNNLHEAKIQEFMRACREAEGWPIVEFHNGMTKTVYPICQSILYGDKQPYSLLGRIQIPLIAAWALTVHKSQGMTLNKMAVNLGRAFEEGQIYVAISRAEKLEGLRVEGDLTQLRVTWNREVLLWLKEKFGQEMMDG